MRGNINPLSAQLIAEPSTRFTGFDYLRVVFMFSVVSVHSNWAVSLAEQCNFKVSGEIIPNFWDYFNLQFQAISVPALVLISCFLFMSKDFTWSRFNNRQINLLYLYIFWVGAWIYCTRPKISLDVHAMVELFIRGGGWQFYFITILILMTCASAAIVGSGSKLRIAVIVSFIAIFTCHVIQTFWKRTWVSVPNYWFPSFFLLSPCFSYYLVKYQERLTKSSAFRIRVLALTLVATLVSAIIEWRFAASGDQLDDLRRWLPRHGRFSVHLAAFATVLACMAVKHQPSKVIQFFARNSLGVYCLHGFVLGGLHRFSHEVFSSFHPDLVVPLSCFLTVAVCALVSEFLRRAFTHRLI